MTPPKQGRMGTRFQRIMLMIPYVINHAGVGIDELAERFGATRKEVIEDLELVWVCGLPGYGPGELIDVSYEDDRVFVGDADYFATPLRLSPLEALALHSGAAALLELPGMQEADPLRRALAKLGAALGSQPPDSPGVHVQLDAGPALHLDVLRTALQEQKQVRLEYMSAARGELTDRAVDPWGLVAALGHVYLVGLDHLSGEERMFRTDRIKTAELLEEDAPVPDDFDPERYRGAFSGRGGAEFSMELSPAAATWFTDYYPVLAARTLDDGWVVVKLLSGGVHWAATLVVRLGRDARNVRPPEVLDAARALAARIASVHN